MNYWLVKQEPEDYAWETFVRDGKTVWSGVRNFTARNNLRAMKKGDRVFYYHSGGPKEIVGIARVDKEAYPDSTATKGDWVVVDLVPLKALKRPITLAAIKSDWLLKGMVFARQSRLSVSPVTEEQFQRILELAETKG